MKLSIGFNITRELKPLNGLFIIALINKAFINTFKLKIYLYYRLLLQSSFN
jgi:hypothetical protein